MGEPFQRIREVAVTRLDEPVGEQHERRTRWQVDLDLREDGRFTYPEQESLDVEIPLVLGRVTLRTLVRHTPDGQGPTCRGVGAAGRAGAGRAAGPCHTPPTPRLIPARRWLR